MLADFKGSNGWLEKRKKRYIRQFTVSGESGDVQGATVDSWKERLPEIVQGYSKDDIWNMDETGVFWQALPDCGFGQRGKKCKGGKKSKQIITIAFFVTAVGSKERPVVIWKYQNPRCMKHFDKSVLPVTYFSQTKAWMTGDVLESILTKLNSRLSYEKRSIILLLDNAIHHILLLDNAGCHPENLKSRFSNIKVFFLPANTTSKLQPLDLGIIQNFKVHYRHLVLNYVVSKIDECETVSDVIKSVSILVAIRWVATAWRKVKAETISKCFRKASGLDSEMDTLTRGLEEDHDDPFLELDARQDLHSLIENTMSDADTV